MLREPLIIPLAGFAGGIVLSQLAPFSRAELAVAVAAFACLAVVTHFRRSKPLVLACTALAMVCAGALTDVLHRSGPAPELESGEGEVLVVSGCVVQPPTLNADREQFVLEIERGARANVSLSLKEGEQPPRLEYGQRVEFDAKLRRPRNYGNPGAFDYVRYLARKQVYWTATARGSTPIRILAGY